MPTEYAPLHPVRVPPGALLVAVRVACMLMVPPRVAVTLCTSNAVGSIL